MIKRLTYRDLLFILFIWYATITAFLALILPSMINKFFLIFFMMIYLYYNGQLVRRRSKKVLTGNLLLIIYIIYYMTVGKWIQLFHADFYDYIGLVFICGFFSYENNTSKFEIYIKTHKRQCLLAILSYVVILFTSIMLKNGLIYSGESGYTLYGPFTIPHVLAYQLTLLYCLAAVCYLQTGSALYLFFKGLFCISVMMTGVRSAFLALIIVMVIDYCSIRKKIVKVGIAYISVGVLLFLSLLGKNISKIAVIQKTITNIAEGSISNNRTRFWKVVFDYFVNNSGLIEKLLGIGIDGVRGALLNDSIVKVAIHAHNDYINILCGFGVIGLLVLIYYHFEFTKRIKQSTLRIAIILILFSIIFTNGLAMYNAATPLLGLLLVYADCNKQEKVKNPRLH
ncbi:O-antigen ligase family protein [Butyrivibrio sp. NC2002]|uniref:O-antigen ligase family protein n=1 Tax=Butyrivibrio sp. NC2002 TaxID=1410610 RepID=UPI00055C453B|nr:O-antigen ligase family protein [Butyrivibrio sp. NC2002]